MRLTSTLEIVPHTMSVADMLAKGTAIILSGGPSSVYEEARPPSIPRSSSKRACPGYLLRLQTMAHALGTVERTGTREYGRTEATVSAGSCLFDGTPTTRSCG